MAAPGALGRKAGPLPVWAWGAAGLVAILAWYLFRRRGASVASTPFDTTGNALAQDPTLAANSGAPSSNSAPADSLSPNVLDALGTSQALIGTLGSELGAVAMNANDNLAYVSSTGLGAALGIANTAVAGSLSLAAQIASSYQGSTTVIYGGGGGGGSGGSANYAPAPNTPANTTTAGNNGAGSGNPFGGLQPNQYHQTAVEQVHLSQQHFTPVPSIEQRARAGRLL